MLKTHYFVCLIVSSIVTDFVRCEFNLFSSFKADDWLTLHSTPAVWEDAFLKCHNDGAVLASPLNQELADALRSKIRVAQVYSDIFLGTHDLYAKGHFASVEGVPLVDMDITWSRRGNVAGTEDCLTMSVDGTVSYSSCNDPLPFICYKNLESPIMNECGTFDNGYQLNNQTGSCYKIHSTRKTWTQAYSVCASEGSYLVILNNENEANIVKDMFPVLKKYDSPLDGFHVGLRAWGKARTWTTIHGERIENVFNKWKAGEPNNWAGNENRGLALWIGELDDGDSDSRQLMFACEKYPTSKRF